MLLSYLFVAENLNECEIINNGQVTVSRDQILSLCDWAIYGELIIIFLYWLH